MLLPGVAMTVYFWLDRFDAFEAGLGDAKVEEKSWSKAYLLV